MVTNVKDAVSLAVYQQQRENIFRSRESVRWFIRRHRARLAERGALIAPTGELLAVVDLFDQVVHEVGAERAATIAETSGA